MGWTKTFYRVQHNTQHTTHIVCHRLMHAYNTISRRMLTTMVLWPTYKFIPMIYGDMCQAQLNPWPFTILCCPFTAMVNDWISHFVNSQPNFSPEESSIISMQPPAYVINIADRITVTSNRWIIEKYLSISAVRLFYILIARTHSYLHQAETKCLCLLRTGEAENSI